jgi:hypothetical protein
MAWTNSKVGTAYTKATIDRTAAYDFDTDSLKVALYNNTGTPDNTVVLASFAYNVGQWVTANEVFQAGQWAQAGVVLTSPTVAAATTVVTLDGADTPSGTAATLIGVFGSFLYDDTLTTPTADPGVCYNYFGGTQSVTAGQLIVVWAVGGIATFTH